MEWNVVGNTCTLGFSLIAVAALLCLSTNAQAGGPIALTDGQLDNLRAGSAIVFSTADSQATGLKAFGNTSSSSAIGSNPSVENGFGSEGGNTSGVAVAWGLNPFGNSSPGAQPTSSTTDVQTGGAAQGNFTMNIATGGTSSALGQTIQVGIRTVYGVFVPGL